MLENNKLKYLIHVLRFVIASSHVNAVWIVDLPRNQCQHDLNGERTSIDEITIEQIRILSTRDSIEFEDIQQIIVLTMDITAYCQLLITDTRILKLREK
jgi:hypothetical protein